jgi:hypothetical protein
MINYTLLAFDCSHLHNVNLFINYLYYLIYLNGNNFVHSTYISNLKLIKYKLQIDKNFKNKKP